MPFGGTNQNKKGAKKKKRNPVSLNWPELYTNASIILAIHLLGHDGLISARDG
jgi:hypothetical protein